MTKFRNNSKARQGLRVKGGQTVWLNPGESADVELDAHEMARQSKRRFWGIDDVEREQSLTLEELNRLAESEGRTPVTLNPNPDLQARVDEYEGVIAHSEQEIRELKERLTTSSARVAELEEGQGSWDTERQEFRDTDIRRQARIEELEAEVARLQGLLDEANVHDEKREPAGGLIAQHRGSGSYSIVDQEGHERMEKLSKAQAREFNALEDDAAKDAWIAANTSA
jgi:chromosome segregation ATPase